MISFKKFLLTEALISRASVPSAEKTKNTGHVTRLEPSPNVKATDKFSVTAAGVNGVTAIADLLMSECRTMSEAFGNADQVLYRGVRELDSNAPLLGHAFIRQDRKPVIMPQKNNDLINKALAALHLPTRANSLFTTTSKNHAEEWGEKCVVFVKDGWQGLVFEGVPANEYAFFDLMSQSRHTIESDDTEADQLEFMIKSIEELKPRIFKGAAALTRVIDENRIDILIQGTEYYTLPLNNMFTEAVLEEMGISVKKAKRGR